MICRVCYNTIQSFSEIKDDRLQYVLRLLNRQIFAIEKHHYANAVSVDLDNKCQV